MALVTFQVIDGLEKGQVYLNLATPVTIGREDENTIRLNDERVSRFHAKVQEDGGRFILTDLDSTNGTRVNGHPVQMRILQYGDQVGLGRSLLVFGSTEQLSERAAELRAKGKNGSLLDSGDHTIAIPGSSSAPASDVGHDYAIDDEEAAADEVEELFPNGPPEAPQELRPVQAAQLSDILAYLHNQIAVVLEAAQEADDREARGFPPMQLDWTTWQRLLKLEMDLAVYLRKVADPDR